MGVSPAGLMRMPCQGPEDPKGQDFRAFPPFAAVPRGGKLLRVPGKFFPARSMAHRTFNSRASGINQS